MRWKTLCGLYRRPKTERDAILAGQSVNELDDSLQHCISDTYALIMSCKHFPEPLSF